MDIDIKTNEELLEILAHCYNSTKITSKIILGDRFWRPFSSLHDQIFDLLDCDAQKIAIAAPRGFGKTTIDTISYPANNILFQKKKYIVPVSATATSAELQSENLKHELLSNEFINKIFPSIKSEHFSKLQWIVKDIEGKLGTMIMPRGAGQQIRGLLYRKYRPDLIICDDLETSEGVRSEEQRTKLWDWFLEDVCNSVDRGSKDWKIVVVGTVLHEDSLLVKLLDDPDWESIQLSICDDDLNSNWPDFMTTQEVIELHTSFKEKGKLDSFYREYRNIPISTEDAVFKQEYFKYYDEIELSTSGKFIENVVIVDPAKTVKLHSADSAVVGWGIDKTSHAMYVRDVVSGKMYPDELYDNMFDMVVRLKARLLAVEVTSLNEFIIQPIKNEIRKRGVYVRLIELKARMSKEDRIAQLSPSYRQGYVYHNQSCCTKLEQQLMAFPRSKLWDVMDAAAYIIELMELEFIYFDPPELEEDEDEYAELEDDLILEREVF